MTTIDLSLFVPRILEKGILKNWSQGASRTDESKLDRLNLFKVNFSAVMLHF